MIFGSFPEITLKKRQNRSYYEKQAELGINQTYFADTMAISELSCEKPLRIFKNIFCYIVNFFFAQIGVNR